MIQFRANEPSRARAPSYCENLGIPMQRQKKPDKIVPRPGTITFKTIQKYAKQTGSTGIAAFIIEV